MDSEELLAQLADIHLPEPVSFWPPAPGWWILAVLIIVLVIWFIRKTRIANAQKRVKSQAISEFAACYENYSNSTETDLDTLKLRYVNQANGVLKRVALVHFTDEAVAGLGGADWVDFVRKNGESSLLNESISQALSHGRFKTKIDVNVDELNDFGHAWISSLYDSARNRKGDKNTVKSGKFEEVTQ